MALNFEYFSADGAVTSAGVFIPASSLWNVQASELASNNASRESRVIFGILEALTNPNSPFVSINNKLGLSSSYSTPVGVGANLINQTYNLTVQYFVNLENNSVQPIPLPSTGSFSGQGGVTIVQVFPGATKLDATNNTGGAGVLVPTNELAAFGGPTHSAIDVSADSRAWFNALFLYLAARVTVRSATQASAVITANPLVTVSGSSPIGALIAPQNPTSGINPNKQATNVIVTRSVSFTLQYVVNTQSETIAPNHVAA